MLKILFIYLFSDYPVSKILPVRNRKDRGFLKGVSLKGGAGIRQGRVLDGGIRRGVTREGLIREVVHRGGILREGLTWEAGWVIRETGLLKRELIREGELSEARGAY